MLTAHVIGLHVCGVNLLRAERRPVVMQVNSSPGLAGIEAATEKDVTPMIFKFIEKKFIEKNASAKSNRNRTQGQG